jgi:CRP-like cAMP-binding protein
MTQSNHDAFGALVRKLDRLATLDDADKRAVAELPFRITSVPAGAHLVREGNRITECCLLLEGYSFRYKVTATGSRQIVSFHLPGDILDLQHLLLETADHGVQTLTPAVIVWIPITALRTLVRERPTIAEALWRDTLIDASIFREWVLNVGQRDARSRIAHMLCEFAVRREAAGLGTPERFELPMGQEHIADATGLTSVHVNRMLMALANDGVIERDKRDVRIADWDRMRRAGDFDVAYLHMAA